MALGAVCFLVPEQVRGGGWAMTMVKIHGVHVKGPWLDVAKPL